MKIYNTLKMKQKTVQRHCERSEAIQNKKVKSCKLAPAKIKKRNIAPITNFIFYFISEVFWFISFPVSLFVALFLKFKKTKTIYRKSATCGNKKDKH